MTLTFDIPDEVACRLLARYPQEEERNYLANVLFLDALEETEELIASMDEIIADVEAGRNTYSLEEVRQQWEAEKAERQRISKP